LLEKKSLQGGPVKGGLLRDLICETALGGNEQYSASPLSYPHLELDMTWCAGMVLIDNMLCL